jgi:hypothetical protein
LYIPGASKKELKQHGNEPVASVKVGEFIG